MRNRILFSVSSPKDKENGITKTGPGDEEIEITKIGSGNSKSKYIASKWEETK